KIASYFAAKSWPAQSATATPAPPPKGIAQCQPCHQPNFQGGPPAPRLAGLSYEYLVTSMHSFATNERTNNGDMPKFMQMLTDGERDGIARYLSDLCRPPPAALQSNAINRPLSAAASPQRDTAKPLGLPLPSVAQQSNDRGSLSARSLETIH